MIALDLDPREQEALGRILEDALSDLRMEIADTDRMEFRERLKYHKAVLQKTIDALRVPVEMV